MHQTFEELNGVHHGYLSLNRLVTQIKSLADVQDERVRRITSETNPAVQRHLRTYLLTNFPDSLPKKVDALLLAIKNIQKTDLGQRQKPFFTGLNNSVLATKRLQKEYEVSIVQLLEYDPKEEAPPNSIKQEVVNEEGLNHMSPEKWAQYKAKNAALHTQLMRLSIALDNKLSQTLRVTAQQEKDNLFSLLIMVGIALAASLFGFWWIQKALSPLSVLVQSAKSIREGNLNVQVPVETNDVLGALSNEFNNLAKALQDRESTLAQNTDQISELRDFFGDIIRSVQVGILVLDNADNVQLVNPAAQSLFGLPPVKLAGQPLAMTHSDAGRLKLIEDAAHVRSSSENRQHRATHTNDRLLDVAIMPIRDASGFSSGHVLVLAEDVTQQENTKQRLVESERLAAIGRIAAQITHEIRNPLSAIGLNIELLEDDLPALPEERRQEARSVLESVSGEIDRLTAITEGYLRVAKLPSGQENFGDIGDLLADLCAFSQEEAAQNGVRLELRVGQNLAEVPFHSGRLRQALLNLLQNALSVAGRGGTVRLSAAAASDHGVRVTIDDTGPGIPPENKDKIFNPFFTTRKKGTGLGLTLTRDILREHNSEIEISDSTSEGRLFFPFKRGGRINRKSSRRQPLSPLTKPFELPRIPTLARVAARPVTQPTDQSRSADF